MHCGISLLTGEYKLRLSIQIYIHFIFCIMHTIDYIPTNVNCEVINPATATSSLTDVTMLNISWYIDHDVISEIRRYDISCYCAISHHHIDIKVLKLYYVSLYIMYSVIYIAIRICIWTKLYWLLVSWVFI